MNEYQIALIILLNAVSVVFAFLFGRVLSHKWEFREFAALAGTTVFFVAATMIMCL